MRRRDDHRLDVVAGEQGLGGRLERDAVFVRQAGRSRTEGDRNEVAVGHVLCEALGVGVGHEPGSQQAEADTHRTVPPWLMREMIAKNDDGDRRKALLRRRDITDPARMLYTIRTGVNGSSARIPPAKCEPARQ